MIPTREEIAKAWYERNIQSPETRYRHGDNKPVNWIPWADAPDWRKKLPYAMADWFLSLVE